MEAVDWENSSGVSSDTEEYLQDTKYEDDEELHLTSGFISKLQFRFLMEIGALLLLDDNGTSLSLNDIYAKVSGGSWELFEVYRHLKSLGYIVGRHGIAWSIKGAKSNCQSVSLQCSPQSSEVVNLESEDESSIVGSFNNMHINEARPVFDVYLPDSKFRKSSPGDPSFVICLTRGDLPSIADIEVLERQCGAIPLRFCHVEYGRVSFFSFNEEELPILP
ncbi:trna-splicing endonuclease subunit sen54 [Quercus suber]|uniref:Trna-splicing endonuclease subunit sen54 n=1 Tax=Quercus suber TaxID=58331 RepID=A0AAW0KQG5_QUESU